MSYYEKKNFESNNFLQTNHQLALQVTEVCSAKQCISSARIAEGNMEFTDSAVSGTYNTIYEIFANMYNVNAEYEMRLGRKSGQINADDSRYSVSLTEIIESMRSYVADLLYEFGDLSNISGVIHLIDTLGLYLQKQRLSREEYETYEGLLAKCQTGDPVVKLSEDEKQQFIELYEKIHTVHAKNMDSIEVIFAGYTYSNCDEDLMNIKVLAYTAPEPYKSVYLNNIGKVTEGELDYKDWPCASYGKFHIDLEGLQHL